MKTMLKNIIILILTLFTIQASSQVYVTSFKVQDAYLQNGKILIKSATSTTEIKIEIGFSTYRDNSTGNPLPGSIKTKLGTQNSTGGVNYLSAEQEVSSSEFSTAPTLTKIYTVNIDKSKLANYTIDLFTMQSGFSWGIYTGKRYNYVLEPTTTTYYNVAKSAVFVKNNCPPGSDPTTVVYSVPANKYSSTISQADADAKAQTEINANGQNKANTEGTCIEFGNVKTPTSSFNFGYTSTEDIKWNPTSFSGQNVRIESYTYDSASNDFILTSVISESTPNTGILINGISHTSLGNIGNTMYDRKIKIISIDSGIGFYSNIFQLGLD